MRYFVRFARQAGIAALFIITALLGTLSGVMFAYADDLPLIFAIERRVIVSYQQIPEVLRNAIVAAEDDGFFDHAGLSISRMLLALMRDLITSGKTPGGSTITQQLARNLFPSSIGFSAGDR